MAMDKTVLRTPRFIIRVVELVFSLLVLALSATWINTFGGGTSNVNFALFTGITSFLLCAMFIAMYLLGKAADRSFLIIEFVITAIYWVFWLAAAAATADTVHWVNDWYSGYDKADCNALKNLGYNTWCGGNVDALRACCAFCWLTWALFTVSLFFNIYHDIMQKKVFSKGAAPAGTTTAAPGSVPTSTVVKPVDGSDTV